MISVHACPLAPPGAWETGGMNIYIREVARHLSDLGVEVDIFTRRQGPDTDDIVSFAEHARCIHIPAGPPQPLPKESVVDHIAEFICNMREIATNDGRPYDVIHSHYWLSGRVGGYFKNAWHVPMIAMFHTLAELKNQTDLGEDETEGTLRLDIERLTVNIADRLVASTPVDRSHLELYYGATDDRVSIIPGGVDLQRFRPGSREAARRFLGWSQDEQVLLYVGRIQRLKGIDLLLQTVALLAERQRAGEIPRFRLVIVGGRADPTAEDPEAREIRRLRELAAQLGVADIVSWLGAVEHAELPSYYQAADVTVMPSTYESFGLVAVESMASGTPVVASRVGGLQVTVHDGQSGFLIPWRDPQLYADGIAQLLSDPELRHRMGAAGRESAAALGWDRTAREVLALYQHLLDERSLAAGAGGSGRGPFG
jgi:D-inositol-3-phosphate glycosyltransferase